MDNFNFLYTENAKYLRRVTNSKLSSYLCTGQL
jgi:hypothetical protein